MYFLCLETYFVECWWHIVNHSISTIRTGCSVFTLCKWLSSWLSFPLINWLIGLKMWKKSLSITHVGPSLEPRLIQFLRLILVPIFGELKVWYSNIYICWFFFLLELKNINRFPKYLLCIVTYLLIHCQFLFGSVAHWLQLNRYMGCQ